MMSDCDMETSRNIYQLLFREKDKVNKKYLATQPCLYEDSQIFVNTIYLLLLKYLHLFFSCFTLVVA